MPRFLLHHSHEPHECGVAFAAFRGHASPLRHQRGAGLAAPTAGTRSGGRSRPRVPEEALGFLPYFLAERATATRVDEVDIP